MVEFKLENGIDVKVANQYMYIEDLVKMCERKIIKALSMTDEVTKNLMVYGYSYNQKLKEFSHFTIYADSLYEQADYLESISELSWFTETREAYILELSIYELLEIDTTELAQLMTDYADAYNNSVYISCSQQAIENGLLNEIYSSHEETGHVFTRIEDIVIEHNEDMQQIASYIVDRRTDELVFREEIPHMKLELTEDKKKCRWYRR